MLPTSRSLALLEDGRCRPAGASVGVVAPLATASLNVLVERCVLREQGLSHVLKVRTMLLANASAPGIPISGMVAEYSVARGD